ncbi:MAG: hypothetical protein ACYDC5_10775 [Candidatus Dormibacteria bacterium]
MTVLARLVQVDGVADGNAGGLWRKSAANSGSRSSRVTSERIHRVLTRPPVGLRQPVWSARTSYALHAALLDWQSSILDEVLPGRRERFPDLEAERDECPIPRLRRTRRRTRSSLAGRSALVGAA